MSRTRVITILQVLLFLTAVAWLISAGVRFRHWTWDQTPSIRYYPDMRNAWTWGTRANQEGYFALYDKVLTEHRTDQQYGLDYVPLRLAVMTLWCHWADQTFPHTDNWRDDYAYNAPLLRLNTGMEAAAAIGMFFLVRFWVRKDREAQQSRLMAAWQWLRSKRQYAATDVADARMTNAPLPDRVSADPESSQSTALVAGEESATSVTACSASPTTPRFRAFDSAWLALLAAALVWLNPASVFSAHGRPTWDVWVIPFYVWALYLASRNNWLMSGVIIGVGVMIKGQLLIIAPFFLLWPIVSLRFGAAIRWLIGLGLAAGLIVSPWQVWPSRAAIEFCIAAATVGPALWLMAWGLFVLIRARLKSRDRKNAPQRTQRADDSATVPITPGRFFSLSTLCSPCTLWRVLSRLTHNTTMLRWLVWLMLAPLAAALWITPLTFPVSTAWRTIGFEYGANKMPQLEVGGAANLAALLQNHYGWSSDNPVDLPTPRWRPTMSAFLITIGYIGIAVCAITAAWYASRNDRRFLLAAAAPWLVYFTVFPMMHERYLLWAALMTAAAAGTADVGLLGLHLLITALSWSMQMNQLLRDGHAREFARDISPTFGHSLKLFCQSVAPDAGWAVMVICLAWLWMMWSAKSRQSRVAESSELID